MKKNNMLRIASVLLVAVLLSTCAISGAFAKYVSETGVATDSAVVAKWGIEVANGTATAFKTEYGKTATDTTIGNTVEAEYNVVAPGTDGSITSGAITGSAEVAVRVTHTLAISLSETGWSDGAYYCPLIITYKDAEGVTKTIKGNDYDSVGDFNEALKAEKISIDYEAGNTDWDDAARTITWEWEFEKDTDTKQNDTADTKLAKLAYGTDGTDGVASSITLKIETVVSQID